VREGMNISVLCDVIILVSALCLAINNITNFIAKIGKGTKNKVNEIKQESEKAEELRILAILNKVLPGLLLKHDIETKKEYIKEIRE
jgi:hypothetical protein